MSTDISSDFECPHEGKRRYAAPVLGGGQIEVESCPACVDLVMREAVRVHEAKRAKSETPDT